VGQLPYQAGDDPHRRLLRGHARNPRGVRYSLHKSSFNDVGGTAQGFLPSFASY
jgi:hypothetical protein